MEARPTWATLGRRARAWRVVHGAWSLAQLAGLGYIWACAIRRRRDRALVASVGFLLLEGAGIAIGRGECPVGGLQESWGDPVPFFDLVLGPRLGKLAFPVLAVVSVGGLVTLVLRPPRRSGRT
jgi:hypothetical protein